MLTVPNFNDAIDTIDDMIYYISSTDVNVEITTNYLKEFNEAGPENIVYHTIGKIVNKYQNLIPLHSNNIITVEDKVPLLAKYLPNFLWIQTRLFFKTFIEQLDLDIFHVGKENLNQDVMSVALPKRSPLLLPFNSAIQQMFEMGIMKKQIQITFDAIPKFSPNIIEVYRKSMIKYEINSNTQQSRIRSLNLDDLYSIFMVYIIGIILAINVLLIEHLYHFIMDQYNQLFSLVQI